MYKSQKIMAFIPARGGSKGLPGKNLRPLGGKPLLEWTVKQCLAAACVDNVVVSTDCPEIAEVARASGAEVPFLRPSQFARDDSPSIEAIFHALDWYKEHGKTFDYLGMFEPTSPLRKKGQIQNGFEALIDKRLESSSLVSVGKLHLENPVIVQKIEDGKVRPFMDATNAIYQRQQYPDAYFPYGVIYAATVESLRKMRTFYQSDTIPYFIERWQNYEIDDCFDELAVAAVFEVMRNEIV